MQATIHVNLEGLDPMMIIGHLIGGTTLPRQGDFSNFTFFRKVKLQNIHIILLILSISFF